MTAKQELLQIVERLSEEAAERVLEVAKTEAPVAARGHEVVVATTNLAHLSSLTNTALWNEIRG